MTSVAERPETALHPLEPLSEEEFRLAARILREGGQLSGRRIVCSTALHEPDHDALAGLAEGRIPGRKAFVTVLDRANGDTFEAVVWLAGATVVSWERIPGAQPGRPSRN